MKNIAYIILFLSQAVFAQSFIKGNELYRKGDFAGAAKQYEGLLKGGEESEEVYFNLGNAYYKQEKVAPAIYNYEKALQLNPRHTETEENLALAHKLVIDDIKPTPRTGVSKALYSLTGKYHYDSWAWVAVSFSGFCLVLFLGYYLAESTAIKRIFFTGMFVAILGIVFSILAAVFVRSKKSNEHPAIVFAEVVALKADPNEKAKDVFILHEGTKVNVNDTKGGWKKVVLEDDSVGWIDKDAIKELE
ncbi:tetratricopeptide repeat protein [Flavobacterium sp. Sd200]|uniref:tetratricopeptide repeat protein n=1 Tax=Flavobacterium sp. Sd200 TaxID=2692211 RepID=UPI001371CC24|nr:tetratricopeptide repeat protein [Flavobacterium sp. Sd200]MXN91406.1 tetratricopeptide repeat protein [Flavobacterium sp. Sd200]